MLVFKNQLCLFLILLFCVSSSFALTKDETVKLKSYLQQGKDKLEKDPRAAEGFFLKALDIERNDVALKGLGWAYWKSDRPDQALLIWEELSTKYPDEQSLQIQLGRLQVQVKQFEQAERTYQNILQKNPGDVVATASLANLLRWKGENQKALAMYQDLYNRAPDQPDLYMKSFAKSLFEARRYEESIPKWRNILSRHPDDLESKTFLGRSLYHTGQYDEALSLLNKVLKKDPDNLRALQTLLLYAKSNRDYKEMKRILKILIRNDPDYVPYYNLLGNTHLQLREFNEAVPILEKSVELNPYQVEPQISIAETYAVRGDHRKAIDAYRNILLKKFPNIGPRIIQGIIDTYSYQPDKEGIIEETLTFLGEYPSDLAVQIRLARLEADRKNYAQAFKILDSIDDSRPPAVPALLYHRITKFPGEGVVTTAQFEDQLIQLKKAGYTSISVYDLHNFYNNKGKLPPKPILLTFDDAIKDVLTYADPILAKHGFQATMFVPTHVIELNKPFFMTWDDLRQTKASGRWDIQCHSDYGHEDIPVDAKGTLARFLINRMWLKDQNRLETEEQFRQRVENDFLTCKQILQREIPGANVIAYSFPFGDFGNESATNSIQDIPQMNLKAVAKHFDISFIQKFPGFNLSDTAPLQSMRINVLDTWTGNDLMQHLFLNDPFVQAQSMRAIFYVEKGDHERALQVVEESSLRSTNPEAYHSMLSYVYEQLGNNVEALENWKLANVDSQVGDNRQAFLAAKLRPRVESSLQGMRDSNSRSYIKPSVSAKFHIADHFFGKLLYEHGFYWDGRSSVPIGEQKAQSDIIGAGLAYEWDDYRQVSAVAGLQHFDTGHDSAFVNANLLWPVLKRHISFIAHAEHNTLELSQAIHQEITQTDIFGGFRGNPTKNLFYSLVYGHRWLSDDNRIHRFSAQIRQTIIPRYGVFVGALADYQDSSILTLVYYAPQGAFQALGEIGSKYAWTRNFKTTLGYQGGLGHDQLEGNLFAQQVYFNARRNLGRHWGLGLDVAYSKSPSYSSGSGILSVSTQF